VTTNSLNRVNLINNKIHSKFNNMRLSQIKITLRIKISHICQDKLIKITNLKILTLLIPSSSL